MSTKTCNIRIPEDIEDALAGKTVMERIRRGEEELISLADWEKTVGDHGVAEASQPGPGFIAFGVLHTLHRRDDE